LIFIFWWLTMIPVLRPWPVYERKVRKKSYRSLRSQFSYLKKNLEELYSKPTTRINKELQHISNYLWDFFTNMWVYELADDIYWDIKSALISWYRGRSRINREELQNFWVEFNKNNPSINSYMYKRDELQLSDYKGSVAWTTKRWVIKVLQDWFKNWLSYGEVAKEINKLDTKLFGMNRAKIIAINETGKAFENWNAMPMYEASRQWANVEKLRQTMHDGKVTQTHAENNALWRVPLSHKYTATWWDDFPPGSDNPRCRCNEQYRIL